MNDRLEDLAGATFLFLTAFSASCSRRQRHCPPPGAPGCLPWWPAAAVTIGEIAGQAIPGGAGLLVLAASLIALTYALARMPWPAPPV